MPPRTALNHTLGGGPIASRAHLPTLASCVKQTPHGAANDRTLMRSLTLRAPSTVSANRPFAMAKPPLVRDQRESRIDARRRKRTTLRPCELSLEFSSRTAGRRQCVLLCGPIRAGERRPFPSLLRAHEKPTPTDFRSTLQSYTSAPSRATTLAIKSVIMIGLLSRGAVKFLRLRR